MQQNQQQIYARSRKNKITTPQHIDSSLNIAIFGLPFAMNVAIERSMKKGKRIIVYLVDRKHLHVKTSLHIKKTAEIY